MMSRRFLPVLALALAIAPRLAAQDPIFRFSANTDESVPVGDLTGPTDIQVRPNTARELNLFVLNPADDPHEMRVQMLDAKGKVVAETKLRAAKKSYARVKLTKPPMPAAVPALAPVPPMPTPAPMGPPAPPGTELGTDAADGTRTFEFKLRLYDDTAIEDELPKAKVQASWIMIKAPSAISTSSAANAT